MELTGCAFIEMCFDDQVLFMISHLGSFRNFCSVTFIVSCASFVLIYRSATLHKKTQEVNMILEKLVLLAQVPKFRTPLFSSAKIACSPQEFKLFSRISIISHAGGIPFVVQVQPPFLLLCGSLLCARTVPPLPASSVALFRLQKREKRLHFLQFLLYIVERMNVLLKKGWSDLLEVSRPWARCRQPQRVCAEWIPRKKGPHSFFCFFHSKDFGVMKSWSQRNSRAKSPKSFSSVPWNSHVGCSRRNRWNPVRAPARVWTTDPITSLAGQ